MSAILYRNIYWPNFPAGDSPVRRAQVRMAMFLDMLENEVPDLKYDDEWRNDFAMEDETPKLRASKEEVEQRIEEEVQERMDVRRESFEEQLPKRIETEIQKLDRQSHRRMQKDPRLAEQVRESIGKWLREGFEGRWEQVKAEIRNEVEEDCERIEQELRQPVDQAIIDSVWYEVDEALTQVA